MNDTMRIDAPKGTRVIFTSTGGLDAELEEMNRDNPILPF